MTIDTNTLKITLTNVINSNAVTHGGLFHSDDVFATVLLSKLLGELRLARVNKAPQDISPDVIIYDIGLGKFDHHQRGGNGARENGVKYSSFGLLWKEFGMQFLRNLTTSPELVWRLIDESLVQTIDATDNGQLQPIELGYQQYGLGRAISAFIPTWDEKADFDAGFMRAVAFAEVIFDQAVKEACSKAKAKDLIETLIEMSTDKVIILTQFLPWQEFVDASTNPKADDYLYICFPGARGGYMLQCIPKKGDPMSQRKALPESWAGLQADKLQEVCGVADATFCHPARFICSAESLEGALEMARIAIEA